MDRNDRPLKSNFLDAMHLCDAWVKVTTYEKWLRANAPKPFNTIKAGIYGDMRGGYAIQPKYAVGLAAYLLDRIAARDREGNPMYPHVCDALNQFLHPSTIDDVLRLSPTTLGKLLLAEEESDYVAREAEGFMTLVATTRKLPSLLQGCSTADEVAEAVRWIFAFCGRSLRSDLRFIDEQVAVAMAEKEFHVSMAEYQARAIGWWEKCKWTVVLGRGQLGPTGVSIILPVQQHAYEDMRAGNREGYCVSSDEIINPSRYLVLQGTAERAPGACGEKGNYSKHTLPAIINQVAILSYVRGEESGKPMQVLSFAATPRSRYRLEKAGYKPLGTQMPESDIALYEKQLLRGSLFSTDVFLGPYLRGLGERADEFPAPPQP